MSDNNQETPSPSGFDEGVLFEIQNNVLKYGSHSIECANQPEDAECFCGFGQFINWLHDLRPTESPPVAQDERLEELVRNEMLSRYGFDPMVKSQMVQASNDQFWQATGFLECVDWMLRNGMVRLPLLSESETTKPQELDLRSCMCPKYLEQIQALTQANECLCEFIRGFKAASDIVCQERDKYRISLAQLEQQIKEFAGVKDD